MWRTLLLALILIPALFVFVGCEGDAKHNRMHGRVFREDFEDMHRDFDRYLLIDRPSPFKR